MADYSTIKGFNVETLASDPYVSVAASGTWASGGTTNTGRRGVGGLGTQTAAIAACGDAPPVGTLCESYNGTAWTEVNNANTARTSVGSSAGTQTAGLVAGGNAPGGDVDNVEKFDGTCWTEVADLNQIRHSGACMGATNTAAIYSGGSNYPPGTGSEGYLAETESWNGSAWTEVGDLNTGRRYVAGVGPSTAALLAGGAVPPGSTDTAVAESWNGSAWTEVGDLNTARRYLAMSGGANAQTASLVFGGQTPPTTGKTESYDGSTWSEVADLGTAIKAQLGSTAGTNSLALSAFGGPPNPTGSEEWATASPPISVAQEGQVWYNSTSGVLKGFAFSYGTGAWASGGTTNSIHSHVGGGAGTSTAGLIASGVPPSNPPPGSACEEYDGTSWTEVNNTNRYSNQLGSTGAAPQTSALIFGGDVSPQKATESYDGTSWTTKNAMNEDHSMAGGAGTSNTAAIGFGASPSNANSESWDGTSWSATSPLNINSIQRAGAGTATAALAITGDTPPKTQVEEWDGSTWTAVAAVNTGGEGMGAAGTVATAIKFAGVPSLANTEQWNGTSWTEVADLATGRDYVGYCGAAISSAMCIGGTTGPGTSTATEEWSSPTPLGIKTFTAS